MKLTNPARDSILEVMRKKELDPHEWYLEFRVLENGAIGLGFTQQPLQQTIEFGDLKLTIDGVIDTEGVVVDYGMLEDRKGLFFGGEQKTGCSNPDCDCNGDCGENCKCKT